MNALKVASVLAVLAFSSSVGASNIRVGTACPDANKMIESVSSFLNPSGLFSTGKKWMCLKAYCEHEWSSENSDFLEKYTEYKQLTDADKRNTLARQIRATFLNGEDSQMPINVKSTTSENVAKVACFQESATEDCPDNVFDAAAAEIKHLIKSDTYTRLKTYLRTKIPTSKPTKKIEAKLWAACKRYAACE